MNARILIVRACAVGDFILNLPALRAIARHNPGARFTLVGYPQTLALAKPFIDVEAIYSIELPPWSQLFVRPLANLNFNSAWVWMKGALLADHLRESGVGSVFHAAPFAKRMHAADHLLATTGLPAPELPDLWLAGFERVIIQPGSGSPDKCWPWFEQLSDRIPGVTMLMGPCEAEYPTRYPRLEGLTLSAVAEEIRRCRAFIGNDSGITHLAAYWGCPTVALFGPSDPRIWGPIGRRVKVLHKSRLRDISVDDIIDIL